MPTTAAARVEAIRRFNRFYTQRIGVLQDGYLDSRLSLGQVRILYEAARVPSPSPSDIARDLDLDPAYLSRVLKGLERAKLVRRTASTSDGRRSLVSLSTGGRRLLATLRQRSRRGVAALLAPLGADAQDRLVGAMREIERTLAAPSASKATYLLRGHQPGDMGWVVSRHGSFYANEYGWDMTFEALVAGIVKDFVERFDPRCERCWIAERDGERVGSVFLVKQSKTVAKLRLLIVDPSAQGLGIGARLVDECTRFARQAGYRTITLWTNSILHAARHLYEKAGYRLVRRGPVERRFGKDLVFETWELAL
ncbi:MAG: bifunctional helix-turn-helix transcriptional regulator/GNAT family N-acetyltransferase [Vicinamibacterales bacterium]